MLREHTLALAPASARARRGKGGRLPPRERALEAAWLERGWVQLCLAASAHSLMPTRPILAILNWLLFFCTPAPLFFLERFPFAHSHSK